MTKKKMKCPKCKKAATGKYRDEEKIDGMYCKPCSIAWNVDWEEQKPLYDTAIDIGYSQQLGKDEFNPIDFHLETIDDIKDLMDIVTHHLYEHIDPYMTSEKFDELKHNLKKLKHYVKGEETETETESETYFFPYQQRGHFRLPVTANEQHELFLNDKYVYVQSDNLMFWLESKELRDLNYDYPEDNLQQVKHIPLSICGIDGNEFVDDQRVVYIERTTIKVIDGEEVEILQGHLKGDGSDILYS